MTDRLKLSAKRQAILIEASRHSMGLVSCPYVGGFERVNWIKSADYLVSVGLLRPYVHGGFEITPEGRAALSAPTP